MEMETDMIGIDSIEVMRAKIKEKVKEEKLKNIEAYLLAPVNNLTEETVIDYLCDLHKNNNDIGFTGFEEKFYELAIDNLIDLIHLCVIETSNKLTKEEVVDMYWNELVNGTTYLDASMTEDLLYHIEYVYDTDVILSCVQVFIKEMIKETNIELNN